MKGLCSLYLWLQDQIQRHEGDLHGCNQIKEWKIEVGIWSLFHEQNLIIFFDLHWKHSSLSFYMSRTLRKRYEGTSFPKGEKSRLTSGDHTRDRALFPSSFIKFYIWNIPFFLACFLYPDLFSEWLRPYLQDLLFESNQIWSGSKFCHLSFKLGTKSIINMICGLFSCIINMTWELSTCVVDALSKMSTCVDFSRKDFWGVIP